MIEAGWHVLKSDFDETAFQNWRREAFKCIAEMVGPTHAYTQYFRQYVRHPQRAEILTGEGILSAAKEEIAKKED